MKHFSFLSHLSVSVLIGMLPLSLAAQKGADELEAYFIQSIKNGTTDGAPAGKVAVGKIDKQRQAVWKAWKGAFASVNAELASADGTPLLPRLDSLSKAVTGRWQLPEDLEPGATMPFYYGAKGAKPAEGYPLFIYLHGSGPKDSEWRTGLTLAQRFADAPSAYFVPQIPQEGAWYRWWQKSKQWAWGFLLKQALVSADINPLRLYVFGISEGGYGSQRLASFYADYWAAAGPMAGGEPLKNAPAENVGQIGFSLRTGADDKGFYRERLTRYVGEALDSLEHLNPSTYHHKVELIPGRGHHIDYSPTTPWLARFSRTPRPTDFSWEDFEMDGLHRKGFYNIAVLERPDSVLRTRYDVRIDSNTVYVAVDNVTYQTTEVDPQWGIELKFLRSYSPAERGRFVVYLDENMVNLYKPVKVVVNGRTAFNGKLRPNLSHFAASTALFGDPERVFPVGVEVDIAKTM